MNYMVNIFELLSNKATITILRYFIEHSSSKFYLAQLTKNVKLSKVSIIKALEKLSSAEFLIMEQVGRALLYSLNNNNTQIKELKKFFTISYALQALKDFKNIDCEIYLYGSSARGENDEKSDIDILIITNKKNEIKDQLSKIKNEKIKILTITQMEYANLFRKDKPFYERIEKDKIRLI